MKKKLLLSLIFWLLGFSSLFSQDRFGYYLDLSPAFENIEDSLSDFEFYLANNNISILDYAIKENSIILEIDKRDEIIVFGLLDTVGGNIIQSRIIDANSEGRITYISRAKTRLGETPKESDVYETKIFFYDKFKGRLIMVDIGKSHGVLESHDKDRVILYNNYLVSGEIGRRIEEEKDEDGCLKKFEEYILEYKKDTCFVTKISPKLEEYKIPSNKMDFASHTSFEKLIDKGVLVKCKP